VDMSESREDKIRQDKTRQDKTRSDKSTLYYVCTCMYGCISIPCCT
jgi:hypothetical protein